MWQDFKGLHVDENITKVPMEDKQQKSVLALLTIVWKHIDDMYGVMCH